MGMSHSAEVQGAAGGRQAAPSARPLAAVAALLLLATATGSAVGAPLPGRRSLHGDGGAHAAAVQALRSPLPRPPRPRPPSPKPRKPPSPRPPKPPSPKPPKPPSPKPPKPPSPKPPKPPSPRPPRPPSPKPPRPPSPKPPRPPSPKPPRPPSPKPPRPPPPKPPRPPPPSPPPPSPPPASWQPLGTPQPTGAYPHAANLALASHPATGALLLAFCASLQGDASNQTHVLSWNGSDWQELAAGGAGPGACTGRVALAADPSGAQLVAFGDATQGGAATVARWTGGAWEAVGGPGSAAPAFGTYTSLDVAPNGTAYVAPAHPSAPALAYAFADGSWTPLAGPTCATVPPPTAASLAIDPTSGRPVIAFPDGGYGNRATVLRWMDGGAWAVVGGRRGVTPAGARWPSLAVDASGAPWVAFGDESTAGQVGGLSVVRYSGDACAAGWSYVGAPGISGSPVKSPALALGPGDVAYLAYVETKSANGFGASVVRFNGVAWEFAGPRPAFLGVATTAAIVFDGAGLPVAASARRLSAGGLFQATVLVGSNLPSFTPPGLPTTCPPDPPTPKPFTFADSGALFNATYGWPASLAGDGTVAAPLLALPAPGNVTGSATPAVWRFYQGAGVSSVGPPFFAAGAYAPSSAPLLLSLAVSLYTGPALAFAEAGRAGTLSCLRWEEPFFGDGSWQPCAGASPAVDPSFAPARLSLAMAPGNDAMYLAAVDAAGARAAFAWRAANLGGDWAGASWQALGSPDAAAEAYSLAAAWGALDSAFLLATCDNATAEPAPACRARVSTWRQAGGWDLIGTTTAYRPADPASDPVLLAVDPLGAPWSAYAAADGTLSAARWDGCNWWDPGATGALATRASLAVPTSNAPVLAYVDGERVRLRTFSWADRAWHAGGDLGAGSDSPQLAVSSAGDVWPAFTDAANTTRVVHSN